MLSAIPTGTYHCFAPSGQDVTSSGILPSKPISTQMSSYLLTSVPQFSLRRLPTYLPTENNTDQENRDVNVGPISSDALDASKKLERLILTTDAKQYGVHLGCPKEAHGFGWGGGGKTAGSKVTVAPSPNFCYHHQRILADKAQKNKIK